MDTSEKFWKIESLVLATVMSKPSRIGICPFGEKGMIAKNILNERYGIKEDYIIDSMLPKYNPAILKPEDLGNCDTAGLVVIVTADNREVNDNLVSRIKAVDPDVLFVRWMDEQPCAHVGYKAEFFSELAPLLQVNEVEEDYKLSLIGGGGNGSYVLLDDLDNTMHVYSVGISDNTKFDEDIVKRYGMDAFLFDHTIDSVHVSHPKIHFFRMGISGKDEPENDKYSLERILSDRGDLENDDLILKMDVEGAEWEALQSSSAEILDLFRQITLELHDLTDESMKDVRLEVLRKLDQTHFVVWRNDTSSRPKEKAGDIILPMMMEVTYVNRRLYHIKDQL